MSTDRCEQELPHQITATYDRPAGNGQSPSAERRRSSPNDETLPQPPVGYLIEGTLGAGAMGIVFLVRQIGLNRLAALKMLKAGGGGDALRFLAEAEAVAAIRHPHVVQVYEYGGNDGRPFLAMEYLPGGSLADRLRKDGAPLQAVSANLIRKIALGVQAAHEQGIVHRDLKPENIVFDAEGEPRVTDFGVAKRGTNTDMTRTGMVMGTPAYMAPEQAAGDTKFAGPGADIYALGVMLFQCLSLRRPFDGVDAMSLLLKVMAEPAPSVRRFAPAVHRDLELICAKCLEKKPHERYLTARELAEDLGRHLAGEPVLVRPLSAPQRLWKFAGRNKAITSSIAAVALSALVGLPLFAWLWLQADAEKNDKIAALVRETDARTLAETAQLEQAKALANETAAKLAASRELARATQVSRFMEGMFQSADPLDFTHFDTSAELWSADPNVSVREYLAQSAARLRADRSMIPTVRANLLLSLGRSLKGLGRYAESESLLTEALALRNGDPGTSPLETAAVELELGQSALDRGDFFRAIQRFRRCVEGLERFAAPRDAVYIAKFRLGWALGMLRLPEAETVLGGTLKDAESRLPASHPILVQLKFAYVAYMMDNDRAQALPKNFLPELSESIDRLPNSNFRRVARYVLKFQGAVNSYQNSLTRNLPDFMKATIHGNAETTLTECIAEGERVFPKNHVYVTMSRYQLANLHVTMGKHAEAETELAAVIRSITDDGSLCHPKMLLVLNDYVRVLNRSKRFAESRKHYDELLRQLPLQFSPEQAAWSRTATLLERARLERDYGDDDAALKYAEEALALMDGPPIAFAESRSLTADLYAVGRDLHNTEEAAAVAVRLLLHVERLETAAFGGRSPELLYTHRELAERLMRLRRWPELTARMKQVEDLAPLHLPAFDRYDRRAVLHLRGDAEFYRGRLVEAEAAYRLALAESEKLPDKHRRLAYDDLRDLAGCCVESGRHAEAITWLTKASVKAAKWPDGAEAVADCAYRIALVHAAAGDLAACRTVALALVDRTAASDDANLFAKAGLALGLLRDPPWSAVIALNAKLTNAATRKVNRHESQRVVAFVKLRMPNAAGAEAALPPSSSHPAVDSLLRGLAACARGDFPEAAEHARTAETQAALHVVSPERPYALHATNWRERLTAVVLRRELALALATARGE